MFMQHSKRSFPLLYYRVYVNSFSTESKNAFYAYDTLFNLVSL